MERYRKAAVWCMIGYFVNSSLIMLSEIPMVPESQRTLFIVTKFLLIVWTIPMAFWLYRDVFSQTANTIVGVLFMIYVIHGQYFRPLYYFAFAQLLMLYSFLFPISKTRFRIIAGFGGLGYLAVFFYRWDAYVEALRHPSASDMVFCVTAMWIIGYIANTFFASERSFREEAMKRFGHIGIQTARVVHDLKGLVAAPKLYVQMLQSKFNSVEDAEAVEVLNALSRDLEGFSRVLFELNQLSGFKSQEVAQVSVSEVVDSLRVLLKNQLSGVQLDSSVQMTIEADKTLFSSMLMNLILNSIDAFRASKVSEPKISIIEEDHRIRVIDNGGGFDQQVLKSISQGQFLSTRPKGSALGLFFVFDGMKKMGGSVKTYNIADGACVELIFPKKYQAKKNGPDISA
ncbi:MAG: ATP-binding protein [Bdellovibrionia bacterium]